jgi:hypothetical protein
LDAGGNDAHHHTDGATLLKDVAAKPSEARNRVRQIQIELFLESLFLT